MNMITVGTPATVVFAHGTYPAVVVAIDEHNIIIRKVKPVTVDDGYSMEFANGAYFWCHEYTAEEIDRFLIDEPSALSVLDPDGNGHWFISGTSTQVTFGKAVYHTQRSS